MCTHGLHSHDCCDQRFPLFSFLFTDQTASVFPQFWTQELYLAPWSWHAKSPCWWPCFWLMTPFVVKNITDTEFLQSDVVVFLFDFNTDFLFRHQHLKLCNRTCSYCTNTFGCKLWTHWWREEQTGQLDQVEATQTLFSQFKMAPPVWQLTAAPAHFLAFLFISPLKPFADAKLPFLSLFELVLAKSRKLFFGLLLISVNIINW